MGHADLWALSDLCTPWCVHVVVTLRVAEALDAGPHDLRALAATCRADADALGRVLRHLVSKDLFAEPAPDRFQLTEAGHGLLEPPARLGLDLDSMGGRMAQAWSTLLAAVRTGAPAYASLFGRPFWDDLAAHPTIAADFDALMGPAGHGAPDPDVLVDGDWSAVKSIVDVGGGTGALLAALLVAHPEVTGILVDLPATVARTAPLLAAARVADRAAVSGQSFFDPLPAGADLYLIKNVLPDWPDREATALLRRAAEAAAANSNRRGRVVLVSGVVPDGDGAPPDLLMLVLVGGKTRTLAELRVLAADAGLRVSAAGHTRAGRFVVECRPLT